MALNEPTSGAPAPEENAAAGNFSPRAVQALALARKEADRFNHNFLGTEHVLLGLIKLGQGTAFNVLTKVGLDLEMVRREIEAQVGTGPDQKVMGNIPYTPRVKKVIALAQKEAKQLGHRYVGTEHLLLGLFREGGGVAAKLLRGWKIEIEQMRMEIQCATGARVASEQPGFPNEEDLGQLTPRAQQVFILAGEEASRLNHQFLGVEHLFLGLIALGQGVAANVLMKQGLNFESACASVEKYLPKEPDLKGTAKRPYTPQLKAALSLAIHERRGLNHSYLGTEHLLLGILGVEEGVMAKIWTDYTIDREQTRTAVLRELDPNFSPNRADERTTSEQGKAAATNAGCEPPSDPRIRWPKPDPVDLDRRYDVYCNEHGQSLVHRNVLFKGVKGLLPGPGFDYTSMYIELEMVDGKRIFLRKYSVFKFCDPGATADGEKVPPKPSPSGVDESTGG